MHGSFMIVAIAGPDLEGVKLWMPGKGSTLVEAAESLSYNPSEACQVTSKRRSLRRESK